MTVSKCMDQIIQQLKHYFLMFQEIKARGIETALGSVCIMTKFSFLLNYSCFKLWQWNIHKAICWQMCANSHKWKLSTSYYSKVEM